MVTTLLSFMGNMGPILGWAFRNMKLSMNYLFGKDVFPFDVLINTCKFSFQSLGAQTLEELKLQDCPIIQGYTIYMDEASWAQDPQGVTPLDVNLSISQPELDGVIQGGVVACQTYDERGHYVYLPVKERIAAVVQRAIKWSKLRHIPVSERKIAIILHNYPPKNSNIGSAAGLDTPESVLRLLAQMKEEGYLVDTVPDTSADLMDMVTSHMTNDRSMLTDELLASAEGRLSSDDYKAYFATLPADTQATMVKAWGEAPGDVLCMMMKSSYRVSPMAICGLRYNRREALGRMYLPSITIHVCHHRINTWPFTIGYGPSLKRMQSFM